MSQVKLTSIERVIAGVYRDLNPSVEINESDMVEWAGEALEHIGAYSQLVEKTEYLKVSDHRVLIPCGLHKVVQVAYKNTSGAPSDIAILTTCDPSEPCSLETCSSCSANICTEDLCTQSAQLVANASLFLEYYKPTRFQKTNYYYSDFKPMRLASGSFSRGASVHCTDCVNLSATCENEYSVDHPYIRTDFKDGYICLAYVAQALDERGFPMIPDEVSYVEAIKRYIIYKQKYPEFIQGLLHPNVFAKLEDDWHWYCKQARGKANMPDTIDKLENIKQQWSRLIPRRDRYYGFFGNLSAGERLNFGNTNR